MNKQQTSSLFRLSKREKKDRENKKPQLRNNLPSTMLDLWYVVSAFQFSTVYQVFLLFPSRVDTYRGTEYLIAGLRIASNYLGDEVTLMVTMTNPDDKTPADATVSFYKIARKCMKDDKLFQEFGRGGAIRPGRQLTEKFGDQDIRNIRTGIMRNVYLLKATSPIEVFVLSFSPRWKTGADSYQPLPTTDYGHEFILASPHSHSFAIMTRHDSTFVNIADRQRKVKKIVKISSCAAFTWHRCWSDASYYSYAGYSVTANNPISVLEGKCRGERFGHTTEALLPTKYWGNRFYYFHLHSFSKKAVISISLTIEKGVLLCHKPSEDEESMAEIDNYAHQFEVVEEGLVSCRCEFDMQMLVQLESDNRVMGSFLLPPFQQWTNRDVIVTCTRVLQHNNPQVAALSVRKNLTLSSSSIKSISWNNEEISDIFKIHHRTIQEVRRMCTLEVKNEEHVPIYVIFEQRIPSKDGHGRFMLINVIGGQLRDWRNSIKICSSPDQPKFYNVPEDGADNDCDGMVDEEIPNELDDDFDSLIDEDLGVVHGGWGPYVPGMCSVSCDGIGVIAAVRRCESPEPSRNGRKCEAPNFHMEANRRIIPCDNTDIQCPETCQRGRWDFECDKHCSVNCYHDCHKRTGKCNACKPGRNLTSDHMCGRQTTGQLKITKNKRELSENAGITAAIFLALFMIVLPVITAVTLRILIKRKKKREVKKEGSGRDSSKTATSVSHSAKPSSKPSSLSFSFYTAAEVSEVSDSTDATTLYSMDDRLSYIEAYE